MLIHFRLLVVELVALSVVAGVAGCSKQREKPPTAKTEKEESDPKTADQEHVKKRQADSTVSSNESHQAGTSEDSGDSHEVNPFDPKRGGNGSSGSVANNGSRADSDGARGGTTGGPVGEKHSSKGQGTKAGVASGYTSNGDPDYKPPSDPRAAQAAAEQALAAAEKAARSNDYGTAYRKALTGWQQANTYSKEDEKCRELARTLLNRLEQYGEKANRAAGVVDAPPPSYKTLILK